MVGPKACTKCGQIKPITEFYFNNNTMRHTSACKECQRTRCREYKRTPKYKRRPRTKEQRRKEYIVRCQKLGSATRFALKSLFEDPINCLAKCTKCKQFKPTTAFWKDTRHKRGYRSQCKKCAPVKKGSRQTRQHRTKKEINTKIRIEGFLRRYLSGDGCCLYCGETEPFYLNNHHIYGRKNDDFTITLCENHHAPFTRKRTHILYKWF